MGIIDDLINEVIKASKIDRNDDNNEVDMLWNKVFDKKIINFMAFLEKIKSTNPLKLMNLIIGFLNKNGTELLEDIAKFLDKNFFKKNKFFVESGENKILIPIFIFNKYNAITKNKNNFKKLIINKLSSYIIDEKTIFEIGKNEKFKLFENLYNTEFFDFEYKNKTLSFISEAINNKDKYKYKDIIKIDTNYNNDKTYYDKVKGVIDVLNKKEELMNFYFNKISSDTNHINFLENTLKFLKKLFNENNEIKSF